MTIDYKENARAQILLKNGATEVITYYNKTKQLSKRKINNGKIEFDILETKSNEILKNFDCIISFEAKLNQMKFENTIEKFSEYIKNSGKLIVSVINKENLDSDTFEGFLDLCYTKNEFEVILKKYFSKISFFSQRLIEEKNVGGFSKKLGKIRKVGSKILTNIDKNRNFYISNLQTVMNKIDSKAG